VISKRRGGGKEARLCQSILDKRKNEGKTRIIFLRGSRKFQSDTGSLQKKTVRRNTSGKKREVDLYTAGDLSEREERF